MADSTRRRRPRHHQAAKPSKDFPLTAHPSAKWCKKVQGKLYYFGPIDNPQAALEKWLAEKDYLLAGKEPPRPGESAEPTPEQLLNKFLTTNKNLNRSRWTLQAYRKACHEYVTRSGGTAVLQASVPRLRGYPTAFGFRN